MVFKGGDRGAAALFDLFAVVALSGQVRLQIFALLTYGNVLRLCAVGLQGLQGLQGLLGLQGLQGLH